MPTTNERDRWYEHYNATKDKQGEPWRGAVAGCIVAAVIGACVVAVLLAVLL